MLIHPDVFDQDVKLYGDYRALVLQSEIFVDTLTDEEKKAWWAARIPEDQAKAEEFRLRILSYVRDLEAEVLKLQPLAKKWTDQELDIEAGINAEFDKAQGNAGALR